VRPRLLDAFRGAGGAAKGYQHAGFYVVGVDINPQPDYCGDEFIQMDALMFMEDVAQWGPFVFEAAHASPPCQAYSVLRRANPEAEYVDLIDPTRNLLEGMEIPYVIENVPGAPLNDPVKLCGSMFGLGTLSGDGAKVERKYRQLRRHRLFETSFDLSQPICKHDGEAIGVYGGGPTGRYTFENGAKKDRYGRRGGYQGTVDEKREAMGIDWMNGARINQAIPPAYTEFIGKQLLAHIESQVAA
jgi:DNA (cytosine-5)-methyltransferase 1